MCMLQGRVLKGTVGSLYVCKVYNFSIIIMTDYFFNNMGRIGLDKIDNTQQNLQNTRFANYTLASYFSNNSVNDSVQFATLQPTLMVSGTAQGNGINGNVVDYESLLYIKSEQERAFEKLQLNSRPFLTVPYLGKGSCDPDMESKLLQGEISTDKKSVSTIMDKSFMPYMMQPESATMPSEPLHKYVVEENGSDRWTRGGIPTREISQDMDKDLAKKSRPSW